MAVIKELDRRGTLKNALAGRDEQGLSRLLNFLIGYATPVYVQNMFNSKLKTKVHTTFIPFFPRNVTDSRFTPVLVIAAEMIFDIYRSVIGQSSVVDSQLQRLQDLLEREIDYQQRLVEVMGMLDALFASSVSRREVPCSGMSRTNGLA